jgi:hypothetical protein
MVPGFWFRRPDELTSQWLLMRESPGYGIVLQSHLLPALYFLTQHGELSSHDSLATMVPSSLLALLFVVSTPFTIAQSPIEPGYGYTGYSLNQHGDPLDVTYSTASTPANVSTLDPEPDVYLNASVHVGIIQLTVDNITAKVNLDAQVLQLLKFNAGVDASIDRVQLTILNITAEVLLEARLGNLVLMINDVLKSLDLNPILATLGKDLNHIVNTTVGSLGGVLGGSNKNGNRGSQPAKGSGGRSGSLQARDLPAESYQLAHNILYSINDYSGHTHTNRVLAQNGSIIDYSLNDDGHPYHTQIVGDYLHDMQFVSLTHVHTPRLPAVSIRSAHPAQG